ncbi:membrane protein insertase YidC [Actinoplanes awajinensis]|nr:membrane protein insertase YidC [Actinoplanes awajinensis]
MSALFGGLMSVVYHVISAVLLFWHAVWDRVLGDPHVLATDWAWVLGIVFLVLTVRALLVPIYVRQMHSQRAMQRLQPKLKELRERHKGDPAGLQAALPALYQAENVSPFGSFVPMLLQIPIFIGLLHVLRHLRPTIVSADAQTLYGWTVTQFHDASHAKLFGAPIAAGFQATADQLGPLGAHSVTVKIVAAVLIVAMITTTYLTSRMSILKTGWAEDPQQRMVQRLMLYGVPVSLLISGVIFPVGVILYWTTQNVFALGQQMWMHRRYPLDTPPATTAAEAPKVVSAPKVGAKPAGRRPKRS